MRAPPPKPAGPRAGADRAQRAKSGRAARRHGKTAKSESATGPAAGKAAGVPPLPAGYGARAEAVRLVSRVLVQRGSLDEALSEGGERAQMLEPRDRAFARMVATTTLRRHGRLNALLAGFLEKPLPARTGRLWPILMTAAAQLLFLDTPAHAAISLAVEQCRHDREARRFDRLANALLRRVTREGRERLAALDPLALDVPDWLLSRWMATYGEETGRAIAAAQLEEAGLDVTPKIAADAAKWAEQLGGTVLATGSIRLAGGGRVSELPGFDEGAWWVQDAAAAIPARLIAGRGGGDLSGLEIADLCAAPGGKTAQLAALGASVTAVDISASRLGRLAENLHRLGLAARTVTADVTTWQPDRRFDAVLLDAPCTATGTIRRHPDILHLRRESDVGALGDVQASLFAAAAGLVAPGGTLIYCTCSLEPEEGEQQIARFLGAHEDFRRVPVRADDFGGELGEGLGGERGLITADGDLRTLPCNFPDATPPGLDGFYAARLIRQV